jgi:hypothetical protein
MDPYLEDEKHWPEFHHQFIACLYQILLPGLTDRYQARVGQRHYATEQLAASGSWHGEHNEEYIEVWQRGGDRLISLIEVVSPANKLTVAGRQAYLDKRREGRAANASLVEIDLVLQGQPTLEYSRDGLPDWHYAVTVTRAAQPERYEIYTATLQKKLPRFRLPLAGDDRDTVLDLQSAFTRCYDQGNFAAKIDYETAPSVALSEEDWSWLEGILRRHLPGRAQSVSAGTGPLGLSQDEIAVAAYYLWQKAGRPQERDEEFWFKAVVQLVQAQTAPRPDEGTLVG